MICGGNQLSSFGRAGCLMISILGFSLLFAQMTRLIGQCLSWGQMGVMEGQMAILRGVGGGGVVVRETFPGMVVFRLVCAASKPSSTFYTHT